MKKQTKTGTASNDNVKASPTPVRIRETERPSLAGDLCVVPHVQTRVQTAERGETPAPLVRKASHVQMHVQPREYDPEMEGELNTPEKPSHVAAHVRPSAAHVYVRLDPISVPETAVPHVYVQTDQNPVPDCAPVPTYKRAVRIPPVIVTNLPEMIPILPEEIALIRRFMGELVSRILANDNEPD